MCRPAGVLCLKRVFGNYRLLTTAHLSTQGTEARAKGDRFADSRFQPLTQNGCDGDFLLLKSGGGYLPNGTQVKVVNGSGTLAGSAHQEAFNQVAKADAVMVSEALQRDFDKPLLEAAFPGWLVEAGFELRMEETTGTAKVVRVVE